MRTVPADQARNMVIAASPAQMIAAMSDAANPHEVGWRLRQSLWGQGCAPSAAPQTPIRRR